jgi:serine/threonine-protein kinase
VSPEQSTGEEVDERSDLFSLGVMLYEMLCGRLPFDGSAVAIAKAHLASEVPPIAVRVPGLRVEPRLEAVAMRLMAKDPADRFQSARALLAHLDSAFGPSEGREDGSDHDATVQVESGQHPAAPRAISAEQQLEMLSYQMAELARSQQARRILDTRWIVTGVVVVLTLAVVLVAVLTRDGGSRPRHAESVPPAAAPEPVPPPARSVAAPVEPASTAASTAEPTPIPIAPPTAAVTPAEAPDSKVDAKVDSKTDEQPEEKIGEKDEEPPARRERPRKEARSHRKAAAEREEKRAERDEKPAPPEPKPAETRPPEPKPAETKPPEPKPQPPAPSEDEVVSVKEFRERYVKVGRQLNRLVEKRGEAATSDLSARYFDIPVQDALRSDSLRREADRTLKKLSAQIARELGE